MPHLRQIQEAIQTLKRVGRFNQDSYRFPTALEQQLGPSYHLPGRIYLPTKLQEWKPPLMLRTFCILVLLTHPIFGQQYDWPALFAAGHTMDEAAQQAARDQTYGIVKTLIAADASLVLPEIPGLVAELDGTIAPTKSRPPEC